MYKAILGGVALPLGACLWHTRVLFEIGIFPWSHRGQRSRWNFLLMAKSFCTSFSMAIMSPFYKSFNSSFINSFNRFFLHPGAGSALNKNGVPLVVRQGCRRGVALRNIRRMRRRR